MKKRISGLAHCCHHDVHWEYCYDYEERVKYIRKEKPASEVKLRLKLFQIIPDDKLPGRDSLEFEAYDKAWKAYTKAGVVYTKAWATYDEARVSYDKARAAYTKARAAYTKAREAYDKAWEAYYKAFAPQLAKLHSEMFPDCTWDGESIFPELEG